MKCSWMFYLGFFDGVLPPSRGESRRILSPTVKVSVNTGYEYSSSSSPSSNHAACLNFLDSLSPFVSIINRFWQVFLSTSCLRTELLQVSYCWSARLANPCEGVHWRKSLMSSSLFLQKCLGRLIWMALEMRGRWHYSCYFVGYCSQNLFNIALSISCSSKKKLDGNCTRMSTFNTSFIFEPELILICMRDK